MMASASAASTPKQHHHEEDEDQFDGFLMSLRRTFMEATSDGAPIFTSSANSLFDAFLDTLPVARRKHYTCHACQRFLERFGGLVVIHKDGSKSSLFWDRPAQYPSFFQTPIDVMRRIVERAHVTGVFLSEDNVWGTLSDKINKPPYEWTHMSITPPKNRVFKPVVKNAEQIMAEMREEYEMLSRGVAEFPPFVVQQVNALASSGSLYRGEKVAGPAKWLLELHQELSQGRIGVERSKNRLWRATATAPAGFCHVRSGVLGTLLEDVQAGLPLADIKQRFAEKMDPERYQRPQSPPKAGNIATAEKIVTKLSSEGAFLRRFAHLGDLQLLWQPRPQKPMKPSTRGVFSHLQPGPVPAQQVKQPPITMTWAKFRHDVLPRAEEIEFLVPTGDDSFVGLVTAASPKAAPILQWDREDRRNPVSWYFYVNGSPASRWGLRPHTFHKVSGITLQPPMWYQEDAFPQHGKKVFFLLDGATDLQHGGIGFFPEMLRSEYHEIRKTIEAHMHTTSITGLGKPTACGIGLQAGNTGWKYTFRVTANGVKLTYILDRWD